MILKLILLRSAAATNPFLKNKQYNVLFEFVEESKILARFFEGSDEVTEAEIIAIFDLYVEGFVDFWTRRAELCILHFPDALHPKSFRQSVEEALSGNIDAEKESVETEPKDPAKENNGPLANYASPTIADTSVSKPADYRTQRESSEERIGDSSNQSGEVEKYEDTRKEQLERGRIWNHLTISRDQTSASDFTRELLVTIFRTNIGPGDHGDEQFNLGPIPNVPLTSHQNLQQVTTHRQRILAYQQQPAYKNLLLGQQLRLQSLRKDCPSSSIPHLYTEPRSDSSETLSLEVYTIGTDEETGLLMDIDSTEAESSADVAAVQDDSNTERHVMDVGTKSENLLGRIALLAQENQALKGLQASAFRCERLYFLPEDTRPGAPMTGYLDEPNWVSGPSGNPALRCNLPEAEVAKALLATNDLPRRPVPTSELINLHHRDMIAAMEQFLAMQPNFSDDFPDHDIRRIPAPYLFWYHYRSSNALDRLSLKSGEFMKFLTSWIEENYAQKDVLVWEESHQVHATIAKDWLKQTSAPLLRQDNKEKEINWSKTETSSNRISSTWAVDSWHFGFDGEFHRNKFVISINIDVDEADKESSIKTLNRYPLRFASPRIKACLERRGKTFWKCRRQHLVSYEEEGAEHTNGERFMVDYKTYQRLHSSLVMTPARFSKTNRSAEDSERLSSEVMENDTPPPSPDIYVFPDTIPGYNIHTKKWALVKHQIASEQGTDIVNRKGNGLIILLHGGPGTGKTFTAETVAEMAEKPLFRVTCGDIGTKPAEVEKYLDLVLYLGKIWNCIVLIDEAEVFLEQRSLDNMERNALSVFLRVLEYYEGILILTSNRVGTFDEALKSRILMLLHLREPQRGPAHSDDQIARDEGFC
ncbi:hypothetical protein PG994_002298 [Apiospora phragmitis]|uniref:AAA+ ATPase domain-containing protein n=1 Tax=Apiospora phragmitis TaxID=2905665 RepID=A0ABR1WVY3_9PEZI